MYSRTIPCLLLCLFASSTLRAVEPQWIWGPEGKQTGQQTGRKSGQEATQQAGKTSDNPVRIDGLCLFRKTFTLPSAPIKALLKVTCDDQYVIRLNDRLVGVDESWQDVEQYEISSLLVAGENDFLIRARNMSVGPAGLLLHLAIEFEDGSSLEIATDTTWEASLQKSGTWNPEAVKIKNWQPAVSFGTLSSATIWNGQLTDSTNVKVIAARQAVSGEFGLQDGDRVLFLGNTVIEREQRYGFWEAALTTRFPEANIVFRNLGWSGDTVLGEARARFGSQQDGFDHLEVHVHAVKPTVIFCGYGSNAAFEGAAGLDSFLTAYEQLLETLEMTGARIVLLAPLKHEKLRQRFLNPKYNANRKLYRDAIEKLAEQRGCYFAEIAQHENEPLTDNGVHLTETGYFLSTDDFEHSVGLPSRKPPQIRIDAETQSHTNDATKLSELKFRDSEISFVATNDSIPLIPPNQLQRDKTTQDTSFEESKNGALIVKGLSGEYRLSIEGKASTAKNYTAEELARGVPLPPGDDSRPLVNAIRHKNELYFHRWRPQNETYLFLFRKHEQGNNAVEIPMFDSLVAEVEERIAELRKPKSVRYQLKKK